MAKPNAEQAPRKRAAATKRPTATKAATARKGVTAKKAATATKAAPATPAPPAKRTATAKKAAASRRAAAVAAVDRTADLSQDVLKSIESAQRAALDAIRTFVDTVDEVLPALGQRPSRREKVIDAALEMADRLVSTQYDFLRTTVRSADRSLKAALPEGK